MAIVHGERKVTRRIIRGIPFLPKLVLENWLLRGELRKIKHRLSEIENRIPEEKIIMLRNINRNELKQEIREAFSDGQTLYYSDIAERLGIDLKSVVDICRELQKSGEIGIDEDALARTL